MKLYEIIKDLENISIDGNTDIEISDIVYDSRKVKENTLFVCLNGINSDGHKYINEAIKMGASAIMVEKDIESSCVTIIKVKNTRKSLSDISATFFGNPCKKLKTIAITGTKGKTTTSFMIKSILEASGAKVGLIGTIGEVIGNKVTALNNTTPESYEIQKCLNDMVNQGCKYAVLEASSIGLVKNRLDNIIFDIGIFTNISHDHIGESEHKNFEEYIEAKSMLFSKCKIGIINTDDKLYKEIIKNHTCKIKTFGMTSSCEFSAKDIKLINENSKIGISFSIYENNILKIKDIFINMPGKFNVYNSLIAAVICHELGIKDNFIIEGLKNTKVKGRFEVLNISSDYTLLIDYAHNALSMESILKTLKEYNPKRIVTMFGAGGNRPKVRRYEMGETCGKYSDYSVITSDNPRFENPKDIINDILVGINKTNGKYTVIVDRKEAIKFCIENAQKGDIIVLAGKGHEDYQEIKGVKYPFDERNVIFNILKNIRK